jgi:hypothetical protein
MHHTVRKSLTALAMTSFLSGCAGGGAAGLSSAPPLSREAAATAAASAAPAVAGAVLTPNIAPPGPPGIAQLGRPIIAVAGNLNNELELFGSNGTTVLFNSEASANTSSWQGGSTLPLTGGAFITSRPAVAADSAGVLDVLVRDAGSAALVHSTNPGGVWSSWATLGGPPGGIGSDPVVSLDERLLLEAFVLGSSATSVWVRSQSTPGVWGNSTWTSLGSPTGDGLTSDPAAYLDVNGNLEVFVVGLDDRVYSKTQSGGRWPAESSWKAIGTGTLYDKNTAPGAITGDPAVLINNNSTLTLDLFARGAATAAGPFLLHSQQNPGGAWPTTPVFTSLGAPPAGVAGDPAVEQNTFSGFPACVGCLVAFVTNSDGVVYYTHQATPGVWAAAPPWISLGALPYRGITTSAPTVAHNADGHLEVFVRSSVGNQLYHDFQRAGGVWSGWTLVGNGSGSGYLNDAVL